MRRRERLDPARRLYDRFCARLARRGITRRPQEGPADFARRAAGERPDLAEAIHAVTDAYIAWRYAGHDAPQGLEALERRVAAFQP